MAKAAGGLVLTARILGGLVVGEVWMWFESSVWTDISVVTALQWLGVSWAVSPRSWSELHQVLNLIPLALALPAIGLVVGGMIGSYAERPVKIHRD
jgi:hypothetical protein